MWLNRNNPPKKDGDDGSRQNKDVRKLFLVNEATSDRLLLKPVIQHSGAVSATCLTRADAVKLQLATQDDLCVPQTAQQAHLNRIGGLHKYARRGVASRLLRWICID